MQSLSDMAELLDPKHGKTGRTGFAGFAGLTLRQLTIQCVVVGLQT